MRGDCLKPGPPFSAGMRVIEDERSGRIPPAAPSFSPRKGGLGGVVSRLHDDQVIPTTMLNAEGFEPADESVTTVS